MPKMLIPLILCCGLLSSCLKDKEIVAEIELLEAELETVRKQTGEIRNELNESYDKERELEQLVRNLPKNEGEVFDQERSYLPFKRYIELLTSSIEYHQKDIEELKQAHRSSLVGLKTAYLAKSDGSKIPNAEIREVTDEHILVISDGTEQKIAIRDLALPVRTKLVYEADLKIR